MEAVVERDHRRASSRVAGDLDRVLDSFGTRVHEKRPLGMVPRCELVQLLADLHVAFVRGHLEAGVGEPLHLLGYSGDDPGGAVADVRDRDPGAEVDEAVPVYVLDDPVRRIVR